MVDSLHISPYICPLTYVVDVFEGESGHVGANFGGGGDHRGGGHGRGGGYDRGTVCSPRSRYFLWLRDFNPKEHQ